MLVGGGWYGGGSAGNYSSSARTRAAGGGGGSGYVWTSSTASSKPSGYAVATKYYLTSAGTYGSGTSGFVSNPNTNGNGYARITLVSAKKLIETYEVIVVNASWKNIEEQIANGTLTGTFNYNGYTIVANPSTIRNSLVSIDKVTVSKQAGTSATITVEATDRDEDVLTYTLEIDGKTYTSTTGEFNVTGLKESTSYPFTVKVSDGISDAVTQTGTVTTTAIPEITSVGVSNVTGASATITVAATDRDGDALTYTLEIGGKTFTSTTGVLNARGLANSTTHPFTIKVSDGLNEVTETGSLTTVENTSPAITVNADYKDGKTTSQFTIKMCATDIDQDDITYELFYSTSEAGAYTSAGTTTVVAGTETTIASPATLAEYTPYWWYITATDGKETITSEKQTLRTYCPGYAMCSNGYTCNESTYQSVTCSRCSGAGIYSRRMPVTT